MTSDSKKLGRHPKLGQLLVWAGIVFTLGLGTTASNANINTSRQALEARVQALRQSLQDLSPDGLLSAPDQKLAQWGNWGNWNNWNNWPNWANWGNWFNR